MSEEKKKGGVGRLLLISFLVIVVAFVLVFVLGRKRLAPAPKELQVSTKMKKSPATSKLWTAFMTGGGPKGLTDKALRPLYRALRNKSKQPIWYADLAKAKATLASLAKEKAQFLAMLQDKGCPPRYPDTPNKDKSKRLGFLPLMQGTKLVGLDSIALAQGGQSDAAVAQQQQLLSGLIGYSQRCQSTLIEVMFQIALLDVATNHAGYLLIHPKVSVEQKTKLLKLLRQISSGSWNPMPGGMRAELAFQMRILDRFLSGKVKPQKNERVMVKLWPWWDGPLTKEWSRRLLQEEIYRAMQPLGPKFWKVQPAQKFSQEISELPKWKLLFQYNAIGMILMSIASPTMAKFTARWHQQRCMSAAMQAAVLGRLRAAKQALPTDKALLGVTSPITGKAFGSKFEQVCAVYRPGRKSAYLKAKAVVLPIAPPAVPAPAQPTDARPAAAPRKAPAKRR